MGSSLFFVFRKAWRYLRYLRSRVALLRQHQAEARLFERRHTVGTGHVDAAERHGPQHPATDLRETRAIRVRFAMETIWSGAALGLVGMLESEGYAVEECDPTEEPHLIVFGNRVVDLERLGTLVDKASATPKVWLCNENLQREHLRPLGTFLTEVKHCFLLHANRVRNDASEFGFPMGFALVNSGLLARIAPPVESESPRDKFCAFIVSSSRDKHDRVAMHDALASYRRVDSYGRVRNNARFPWRLTGKHAREQCFEVYRSCRFVLCFENSRADNYITEKLLLARAAGAVPIYRGAANVGDYFNTQAFIHFDDHGSVEAVVDRVKALDADVQQYERMRRAPFFMPGFLAGLDQEKRRFARMVGSHALHHVERA